MNFLIDENMTSYLNVNEMKVELMKIISNYEAKNDDDLLNMCSECYIFIYEKINEENERKQEEKKRLKRIITDGDLMINLVQ